MEKPYAPCLNVLLLPPIPDLLPWNDGAELVACTGAEYIDVLSKG